MLVILALSGCPTEPVVEPEPSGCDVADPEATVGLRLCTPEASPGLTLLAPTRSRTTYLLDEMGLVVNSWESAWTAGLAAYLTPGGTLLRAGKGGVGLSQRFGGLPGAGGIIEEFDWAGDLIGAWQISGPDHFAHHDVHRLPSGNILALVWEALTTEEAIALGRDPAGVPDDGLLMDAVYELDPTTGEIVWRWRTRDHLVQDVDGAIPDFGDPSDRPGRVDVNTGNTGAVDWTHFNGLDHDPDTDLLVVSVHGLDEVWVIDHDTTTDEAAGEAGDLLFRWGRPENWGGVGPRELYRQHDPTWLPDGRLLVFDNGVGRPGGDSSRVVEVEVPFVDGRPEPLTSDTPALAPVWTWSAAVPTDFFAQRVSGAQRLSAGNTLVTEGPAGRIFELDVDGGTVWEYVSPVTADGVAAPGDVLDDGQNAVFKVRRYVRDGEELGGLDVAPGDPLVGSP